MCLLRSASYIVRVRNFPKGNQCTSRKQKELDMRSFLSTALLVAVSAAIPVVCWAEVPDWPTPPLYMAPGFDLSQVHSVCLAPTLDLKPDENLTLRLSGTVPPRPGAFARFWGTVTQSTADADLANTLQTFGYRTANCKMLVGTVDDLKEPLGDSFLSGLDFGNSRFLFVVGVEDRSTTHLTKFDKFVPGGLG